MPPPPPGKANGEVEVMLLWLLLLRRRLLPARLVVSFEMKLLLLAYGARKMLLANREY